jgi:hypothetical protein
MGWKGREKGLRFGFPFFFQTPFRTLQTSLNPKTMHLNYDAQELIDSKIIKMIFKYLKAKFI